MMAGPAKTGCSYGSRTAGAGKREGHFEGMIAQKPADGKYRTQKNMERRPCQAPGRFDKRPGSMGFAAVAPTKDNIRSWTLPNGVRRLRPGCFCDIVKTLENRETIFKCAGYGIVQKPLKE